MDSKELLSAALDLPVDDRAKIARELLRSLDDGTAAEHERRWLVEVTRRAQELADGTVQPVDWAVARERIARRLRERRQ